ncbi:MAG: hypothetical protein ACRD26_24515, partial [Vicinamibacterales bacterium]
MFLHGCNYPWSTDGSAIFYGLDFGANVWGSHLGVSTRRDAIARDFDGMAALGFTVARWFVFCDGRSGILYDDGGMPAGLDDHFFEDLDMALGIARGAGIRLVLVLLDHRWMFDGVRETIADPVSGLVLEARLPEGRAKVLLTAAGHDALFERVIVPVLRRYGPSGARADLANQVAAWEIINEPDWVIEEWERDASRHVARPLPFATLAHLVARFSDAVHRYTGALAMLGGGRVRNLWAWDDDGLGLDVLQVHQFPDTRHPDQDTDLFGTRAADLAVRRAVVLGEFPGNGPAQHPAGVSPPPITLGEYLEFGLRSGYAGAWPWSFSGTDAYGRLPREPLRDFGLAHPE